MNADESTPLGVENVALVHGDRATAVAAYERLGFTLTDPSHYLLGGEGGRELGLANHHALFPDGGYWEIVSIDGSGRPGLGYDELLDRHGDHLAKITLRLADPAVEVVRLTECGVQGAAVVPIRRTLTVDGAEVNVDMELVAYPPEWDDWLHSSLTHADRRVNYVPSLLHHPNGVRRIAGVVISTSDPGQTLARLEVFAGRAPVGKDSAVFGFPDGTRLEVWSDVEADRLLPVERPGVERLRAVVFAVESVDELSDRYAADGIPTILHDGRLIVTGPAAAGANLIFEDR